MPLANGKNKVQNESTTPGYKILNVVYALLWCAVIWGILPKDTSPYVLLIPFFWFIHTRITAERLEELREQTEMNTELLLMIAKRDPNFDVEDFIESYEEP